MNRKGAASMYLVYSVFLLLIILMLTILITNNYKAKFLTTIKSDIKASLVKYSLETPKNP